jgi:hypothetical protein
MKLVGTLYLIPDPFQKEKGMHLRQEGHRLFGGMRGSLALGEQHRTRYEVRHPVLPGEGRGEV